MQNAELITIIGDGNCQYRAAAYCLFNNQDLYNYIKQESLKFIFTNPHLFKNFILDNDLNGYLNQMIKDKEYGDELTLSAISLTFDICINVYDYSNNLINSYNSKDVNDKVINLYYDSIAKHYDCRNIMQPINNELHYKLNIFDNCSIKDKQSSIVRATNGRFYTTVSGCNYKLLYNYRNNVNWDILCSRKDIPINDINFIKQFEEYINWNIIYQHNDYFKVDKRLILKYVRRQQIIKHLAKQQNID